MMMKYGEETPVEHRFGLIRKEIEQRSPWIDVFVELVPEDMEAFPEELNDPGILVISNLHGELVQIVLQNEGCDSEYHLTYTEKEQVEQFFYTHCVPFLKIT
ncbi:hypothetical protein D3C73_510550 [compost metagenome]